MRSHSLLPLLLLSTLTTACTSGGTGPDDDDDDDDETDEPQGCDALPDDDLFVIAQLHPLDVEVGSTRQIYVYRTDTIPGAGEPVNECVTEWRLGNTVPTVPSGLTIDETGLLTVHDVALPGSSHVIEATLTNGRTVSATAWVYSRATHPQVGKWTETGRFDCAGVESAPAAAEKIEELYIGTSGRVQVTWTPFEVYVDYWTDATFAAPEVSLGTPVGNYIPEDLDPQGTYAMDGDDLVLSDMFLGTHEASSQAACGHRFSRY